MRCIVTCVVVLAGCAGWQHVAKTSLDATSAAAETAHKAVRGYYDQRCEAAARSCAAARLPDCEALRSCQAERHRPIAALSAIQTACMLGYSAIAIADKQRAVDRASEAARALADLIEALRDQGVLK